MAKYIEKQKAIELRRSGQSYSQIRKIIKVSKSTLSLWLKNYPLSAERFLELTSHNERRIENYIKTRRAQKEKILKNIYDEEKPKILPLSKKELFIAGLFLYWGEGSKTNEAEACLSNTNPSMIKFFIYWIENALNINRKKIKVKLHLYKDMDIKKETNLWSRLLSLKISQFTKPYIKDSATTSLTYKKGFGHGTCNILVYNAILHKRILMGLKAIEDYFNLKYK